MLTEVLINSTNISSVLLSYEIDNTLNDEIDDAIITTTNTIYSVVSSLSVGNTVTIKRGISSSTDVFEFSGLITQII